MRLLMTAAVAIGLTAPVAAGERTPGMPDASPMTHMETWAAALQSGDVDIVASILSPEFQVVRANGDMHTKAEYLSEGQATIKSELIMTEVHAVEYDGVRVVSYMLTVEEEVDGVPVAKTAPRLTVFRELDDRWYIVSHANLAPFLE